MIQVSPPLEQNAHQFSCTACTRRRQRDRREFTPRTEIVCVCQRACLRKRVSRVVVERGRPILTTPLRRPSCWPARCRQDGGSRTAGGPPGPTFSDSPHHIVLSGVFDLEHGSLVGFGRTIVKSAQFNVGSPTIGVLEGRGGGLVPDRLHICSPHDGPS